MLRIAGELASGTILWMADERAIGEHVRPAHHEGRGRGAGGPRRGSSPASRSRCAATTRSTTRASWANQALGHAEYSPNYQRLLEHGDATDVGDLLAAGDESAVVDGCAASATRASPTSRSACCRSGPTATRASSRATGRSRSSLAVPRALTRCRDMTHPLRAARRDPGPRGRAHPRRPVRRRCCSPTSAPT